MKKILFFSIIPALFAATTACSAGFQTLDPREFQTMLENKDFFLMDVHVPEHRPHIPGTDIFIDYRTIGNNAEKLPADKDATIIVYCLGGPMGEVAAKTLVNMGYTDVYNLRGGFRAYYNL